MSLMVVNVKGGLKTLFGEQSFVEIAELGFTLRSKFYLMSRAEARVVAVYGLDAFGSSASSRAWIKLNDPLQN